MKNIALLIAIFISLATVPVAQAQRWDLIEDFSTTSNTQGDLWTYANGAPGVNEVTLKEMFDDNFHGDAWIPGPAQGAWSIDETDECCGYFAYNSSNVDQTFGIAGPVASGGNYVSPPDAAPGEGVESSTMAVWTSPIAGSVNITYSYRALLYGAMDFYVDHFDGTETTTLNFGSLTGFDGEAPDSGLLDLDDIPVAIGDQLRFVLDNSDGGNWDSGSMTATITFGDGSLPTERAWGADISGDWNVRGNWSPRGVPNANDQTVTFGGVINTPQVVFTESDVTVKGINFLSGNSYAIVGSGSVNLEAGTPPSNIEVLLGDHKFQAPVNLNNDAEVTTSTGASITFHNSLNLNGHTLTKFGDGDMSIRNDQITGNGTVSIQGGSISGNGTVGGDLSNDAGSVAPGNSPGILSVDGNFTQSAGGTLEIELASNDGVVGTDHDRLDVALSANLDGTLDLQLDEGYTPTMGDSFAGLVTAGTISGEFATISNVVIDGRRGVAVTYTGTTVDAQIGLRGNRDIANGDLDVDTSDLTTSIINFTGAGGTGKTWAKGDTDGDGDVDTSDLTNSIINFTGARSAISAHSVPEPHSLILLLVGMVTTLARRRRNG